MARGLAGRLLLLYAPAGYGKTTLLASVAADWGKITRDAPHRILAWYRLDDSDCDPAVFMDGMVESIRRQVPGFGGTTRAALRGATDTLPRFGALLALLQDEMREAGLQATLALDDFQHIKNRAVIECIEGLIRDGTSPLRLAIASESDLPIYRSHLRSRDELVELRSEDLGFTGPEVEELAFLHGGEALPSTAVRSLVREAHGWPSAARIGSFVIASQKAPLSLNRMAPTEHGHLRLVRELLSILPDERRGNLLKASLLVELDAEACEVVGIDHPEAFLSWLRQAGLCASNPAGYSGAVILEPSLSRSLQRQAAEQFSPFEMQSLRARIGRLHLAREEYGRAVGAFLAAGLPEDAAVAVEMGVEGELELGHLDTVLSWIRSLPNSVRRGRPRLMVQESRPLLVRGQIDEARALLVAARPELEAIGDRHGLTQQLNGWIFLRLQEGRYDEARRLAERALAQFPGEDSPERAEVLGMMSTALEYLGELSLASDAAAQCLLMAERVARRPMVVRALKQLSRLARLRGDLELCIALGGRAMERSVGLESDLLVLSEIGPEVAMAYLDRGQQAEAMAVAGSALGASRRLRLEEGQLLAHLVLFRLRDAEGDAPSAERELAQARGLAPRLGPRSLGGVYLLQAEAAHLLRHGRREEAMARAKRAQAAARAVSHQPLADQGRLIGLAAEIGSATGVAAVLAIRSLLASFRRSDSRQWLAAGLRLLARGYLFCRMRRAALRNLSRSLSLAEEQGYVGLPLGLRCSESAILDLAIRGRLASALTPALLDVRPPTARRIAAGLIAHQDPAVRASAEQIIRGLDADAAPVAHPRIPWSHYRALPGKSARVRLNLLGGFVPVLDGSAVSWPSPDARDVAAYLLVRRGEAIPQLELLADVWPGLEPWQANVRMQAAISQLRDALGPGYPTVDLQLEERGVYRWTQESVTTDADLFWQCTEEARLQLGEEPKTPLPDEVVSLLEEGERLYQGDYLAGLAFAWSDPGRVAMRERFLWSSRLLLEHYMALGRWRDAVRSGLASLRSDPLQEDITRAVMLCYYRLGERDSVLRQYQEIKRLLAKTRGVWPSDETRQLRVKLLGR